MYSDKYPLIDILFNVREARFKGNAHKHIIISIQHLIININEYIGLK